MEAAVTKAGETLGFKLSYLLFGRKSSGFPYKPIKPSFLGFLLTSSSYKSFQKGRLLWGPG